MSEVPNYRVVTTIDDIELIVRAGVAAFAERHDIEPDTDDLKAVAAAAGAVIVHMHESALFANEAAADLAALPTTEDVVSDRAPKGLERLFTPPV